MTILKSGSKLDYMHIGVESACTFFYLNPKLNANIIRA